MTFGLMTLLAIKDQTSRANAGRFLFCLEEAIG
ncbi:hypothetical protein SAMN02744124_01524 [Paenibacillus barengoltzii J12]|uniref:Uncharacterized protein n=1 Tax=Paenibacillus barengoltzii J12 TaxID=935846 RepID=A0ABY1LVP1_9BACL|nr:hypothetical protein SAMN02744124_01524 [Paenibacillus barengoltzii J12]